MFKRLYVKGLVWRGMAIDVWSKSPYPANVLSNLYPHAFEIDGVRCASMEGFLQALKYKDDETQKEICALSGKEAKERSISDWQETQTVYWKGSQLSGNHKIFKHSSVGLTNACLSKMTLFVMPCSPPKESASITREGYPTYKRLF